MPLCKFCGTQGAYLRTTKTPEWRCRNCQEEWEDVDGVSPIGDAAQGFEFGTEDLKWRPSLNTKQLSWRELKQLRTRKQELRRVLFKEPFIVSGDTINAALNEADERLGAACREMFPVTGKPKSVERYERLKRSGLPTFGLEWRAELWYTRRRLTWEYNQWIQLMFEKADFNRGRMLNTLIRQLPLSESESEQYRWPYPLSNLNPRRDRRDASVAYGWLNLHGFRLSPQEWYLFLRCIDTPDIKEVTPNEPRELGRMFRWGERVN